MVAGWFSSRSYYPFGKGPGQHIIRCLKNKKCENERNETNFNFFNRLSGSKKPIFRGFFFGLLGLVPFVDYLSGFPYLVDWLLT